MATTRRAGRKPKAAAGGRRAKRPPRRRRPGARRGGERLKTPSVREMLGRLKAARLAAGLTQKAAADAAGLSVSQMSKVERGKRRLDPLELGRLARLYGKSIRDFVQ